MSSTQLTERSISYERYHPICRFLKRLAHPLNDRGPTTDGIVKLSGVQLFSGTSRHHAERRSGSEDLFCDLIPHLKSGGNF
ncbi:hypothetical protein, partial [Rhodococcus qingshengii]|uniref:hypothetical protein n=1 Tax=Rhodococcus qingshengii TaxID=334542 RepID=UPI0021088387